MMISTPLKRSLLYLFLTVLTVTAIDGCAYFNTFYLARRHFADAEALREKAERDRRPLPPQAQQSYQKSLEFATSVLIDYPNSRWVEEALLLSQKVLYRQGNLAASTRKGQELIETFPGSPSIPECRLYLARGLLGLGEIVGAANEAGQAAAELEGKLHAEALLTQALAFGLVGDMDRARALFDELLAYEGTPRDITIQAKLDLQGLLGEVGEYEEAASLLVEVLSDPEISSIEKQEITIILISLLLKAGEISRAEEQMADLERMDDTDYYEGLLKYFRAVLAGLEGDEQNARNEMVLALVTGVTGDWEVEIRLDLATRLEANGDHFLACPEYRAVATGAGATDQKELASRRAAAIVRLFALRSMVAMVDSVAFRDPRSSQARSGAAGRTAQNLSDPERRPDVEREDPEVEGVEGRVEVPQEVREFPLAVRLGDVPPGMYLYLIAEHFALEMNQPDSALVYIEILEREHPDSDMFPRTLYAMREWMPDDEEGRELSRQASERLLNEFAGCRWAYYFRKDMGENPEKPLELKADESLLAAEEGVDLLAEPSDWSRSLSAFYAVAEEYPGTEAAGRAELAAARLLELGAGPADSARAAYERIIIVYPDSREALLAAQRLGKETTSLPPDPLAARENALGAEIQTWTTWFQTRQAARVTRLQPRTTTGQRAIAQQQRVRPDRPPDTGRIPPS